MENDIIFSFIANHLKSVELHLSEYKKDRKNEHIHHLRIDIKKIKAIFSFIENIYNKKFELNRLKLLFKKAGEIRELQINIALLSPLPVIPQTVILQFKKKEKILQHKFIRDIPRHLRLVKAFRKRTFFSFLLPEKKIIRNYFRKRKTKAIKYFNRRDRVKMHRFRKLIKKMMYLYAILPKKNKKVAGLDKGLINKLQKKVGIWHDTYSAINFLSRNHFILEAGCISTLNQQEARLFADLFFKFPDLKI